MADTIFGNPIRVITASGYYYWGGETQNNVHIVGLVTDKIETIQAWSSDRQEYIETDAYVVNVIQHDGCNLKSDVAYVTNTETTDTHDMYAYYYAEPDNDNPNSVYGILGGGVYEAVLGDNPTITITNTPYNAVIRRVRIHTNTYGGQVENYDISVADGGSVTIPIDVFQDYRIDSIVDNDVPVNEEEYANNTYTINNIYENHHVTIQFRNIVENVTYCGVEIRSTDGGTITTRSCTKIDENNIAVIEIGTVSLFTITPNEGYEISDVVVDYVSVGAVDSYNFGNITDNHIISATFAPIQNNGGNGGNDNPSDPPAPDEPTPVIPADGDDQKQCTKSVRDYIVKRTGAKNFSICYSKALNEYANYQASGSQDFAVWFVDTYLKGESEYITYINGLLSEGFTHLDIMTVWEYAEGNMSRLEYIFKCIRNCEKTYGRYVEINGTTGTRGKKQNFYEFHLKGGFSGEKAVINGVSYYVVDVTENYGWNTREKDGEIDADGNPLPNTTVREYCEPVCLIDDGMCYFKSRTTTNPDDMFIYLEGMWMSVGYIAMAFAVTSDNYTIEYSGNGITAGEKTAEIADGYTKQADMVMNKITEALADGRTDKARAYLTDLNNCYHSIEKLFDEYM